MPWLQVFQIASGITSGFGLVAFLAVLFVWISSRRQNRSLHEEVQGSGLINDVNIKSLLEQYSDEKQKMNALVELLKHDRKIRENMNQNLSKNARLLLSKSIRLNNNKVKILSTGAVLIVFSLVGFGQVQLDYFSLNRDENYEIAKLKKGLSYSNPENDVINRINTITLIALSSGQKRVKKQAIDALMTLSIEKYKNDKGRNIIKYLVTSLKKLTDGDFRRLNTQSYFENADLVSVDLSGGNFDGMNFKNAFIIISDFRGATMRGADLSHVLIRHSDFTGADLNAVDLTKTDWFNAIGITLKQIGLAKRETVRKCPTSKNGKTTIEALKNSTHDLYKFGYLDWPQNFKDNSIQAWEMYVKRIGICNAVSVW